MHGMNSNTGHEEGPDAQEPDLPLRVEEYSLATLAEFGLGYPRFCEVARLPVLDDGYGLLHCLDRRGRRVTAITPDVEYVRLLIAGSDAGILADVTPPIENFPILAGGWPDDWAAGSPPTFWRIAEHHDG